MLEVLIGVNAEAKFLPGLDENLGIEADRADRWSIFGNHLIVPPQ